MTVINKLCGILKMFPFHILKVFPHVMEALQLKDLQYKLLIQSINLKLLKNYVNWKSSKTMQKLKT